MYNLNLFLFLNFNMEINLFQFFSDFLKYIYIKIDDLIHYFIEIKQYNFWKKLLKH
jgi:hypothetical protein